VLEVLYHRAKFGGARISPAAGVAKNVEFFCLSVCLFVRHAFERQRLCARFRHEGVGVQKRFWCCWIGLPLSNTKCRSPKNGKNWGCFANRGPLLAKKKPFLPFFGLWHLVLSPIGNSLTKLNTAAQLHHYKPSRIQRRTISDVQKCDGQTDKQATKRLNGHPGGGWPSWLLAIPFFQTNS